MILQLLEFRYLLPHGTELHRQEIPHMRTRGDLTALENEKFANLIQREAQMLSTPDEVDTLHVVAAKQAEASLCARRALEKALLLIKTNRVYRNTGLPRHLSNSHAWHRMLSIHSGVRSRVKLGYGIARWPGKPLT